MGLMGKTLLEFQPNKGDVLPSHKVRLFSFLPHPLFWVLAVMTLVGLGIQIVM